MSIRSAFSRLIERHSPHDHETAHLALATRAHILFGHHVREEPEAVFQKKLVETANVIAASSAVIDNVEQRLDERAASVRDILNGEVRIIRRGEE